MRKLINIMGMLLIMAPGMAAAVPSNMLVYISPQEYTHSIKLWQYFVDYWFKQGPVVEPIARSMLAETFGKVDMCAAQSEGQSLVWIQPRMYYNPQMKTYYGEIKAKTYSSKGELIAEYVGEASKQGYLDVMPQVQVEEVYKDAMQRLVAQMQQNPDIVGAAANGTNNPDAANACAIIATLPPPKPIDINYFFKSVHQ